MERKNPFFILLLIFSSLFRTNFYSKVSKSLLSNSIGKPKKENLLRLAIMAFALVYLSSVAIGQTTYYWVGGATASYSAAVSWNTTLGGGGATRSVFAVTDILTFDGTDISSVAGLQTGAITSNSVITQTIGRLILQNNAGATLTAAAGRILTVGNGAGTDLIINAGSTLTSGVNVSITMNSNAAGTIDGILNIGAPSTFTSDAFGVLTTVNGTINNSGTVIGTVARLAFNNGSNYNHTRDGGAIPLAAWGNTSTCRITGITGININTITLDPSFGNFIWDCPGLTIPARLTANTAFTFTVNGNMDILRTYTGSLNFTNGNLNKTLQVNGNITVGNGIDNTIFDLKSAGALNTTVNLGGNLTVLPNATLRSTSVNLTAFNFGIAGTATTVLWGGSGTYTSTNINYVIQNVPAGKTVNLSGFFSNNITIPLGRSLTVNNGATLNCVDQTISGAGTFTLQPGGILGIGHVNGINSNLTTSTQTLNGAGTTFVYNGTAAQITGTNLPGTVPNLTFNNASGVSLSANVITSNTLTMTQGNVISGTNTLALSNPLVGSLTRVSGTVIGKLMRSVNTTLLTDYIFPVGTAAFYRPAIMKFSSLTSGTDITTEFIETPPPGFAPYADGAVDLDNVFTEGYWRFFSSALPAADYSLLLTANGFSSFIINEVTRITGRDNGNTTWRPLGSHGTLTGNDITRTGITNLNSTYFDYALATGCSPASMGFTYERNITVDNTKVAGGSDLSNFPMLISLTAQNFLKLSPTGQILNANCYDLIFTDVNYNKLDHQIEYYNGTNGDLIAWVRIPTLSSSSNTIIKVLYGNPLIATDPSVTSVWDSHYKGVWHLDDNNLFDFTSFNKPGSPFNTPGYPAGQVYNALGLNGGNQYVVVNNDPNINFTGNLTVSAWIFMSAGGLDQKITGNQDGIAGGYKFGIYTNNKVEFEIRNTSNIPYLNRGVPGGTTLIPGQWYYVAGISSDVLDSIKTFVSGVPERPFKKTGTLGTSSNNLTIAKEPWQANYFFNGRIDELRISDEVRSNGWLRTEYNNQFSPSTFYSLGAEGPSNNLPSASICSGPITLTFGYPSGGTYSGDPNIIGNVFTPPSSGTYSITYTFNGGCGSTFSTKDFNVTDTPPPPVAPNKEYCTGTIAYLQTTSGDNVRWYSGAVLVSTANPFSTGQTAVGTYNYTVTQTINGCESAATPVTLTIFAGSSITGQPASASKCVGDIATFSVTATGPNLTYQWRKGVVNLIDGGTISGVNSPNLNITNVQIADAGNYTCIVSSSCGAPLTSNIALLQVDPAPIPAINGNNLVCPYSTVNYFTANIVGHTYNWVVAGGTIIGTSTGSSINVDWGASGPGTVTVTETVSAGCFITQNYPVNKTDSGIPVINGCPSNISVTAGAGLCSGQNQLLRNSVRQLVILYGQNLIRLDSPSRLVQLL